MTFNHFTQFWFLEKDRKLKQKIRLIYCPQITLRADQKNWRQRIETLKQNREHIEQLFKGTEKKLTQISNDIGQDLEKTSSREKYINQQLDGLINDLRSSHDKLAKAKVFLNCRIITEGFKYAAAVFEGISRKFQTDSLKFLDRILVEDKGKDLKLRIYFYVLLGVETLF